VRPPYRIFPIPRYFAQRRVFHFHDCAHGDSLRRRQEWGFDVSWIPHDGAMDSSDASNVYITDGRSYNIYFLWLGERMRRNRKLGDASATTIQNIPMLPIFRSTTCLSLP
jgi:hypothetical protein